MSALPPAIENAIEAFSDLPGIGRRSAERLVFRLLQNKTNLDQKLAASLTSLRSNVHECSECCHYSEEALCSICQSTTRNHTLLCIVESPMDLIALERTHEYKGLYHVLHGVLSPLNGIRVSDIRIPQLLERLQNHPEIQEIILALSSTTEADATSLYIIDQIKEHFQGTITRLSRGIPSGGDLDYLDSGTLTRALQERRPTEI